MHHLKFGISVRIKILSKSSDSKCGKDILFWEIGHACSYAHATLALGFTLVFEAFVRCMLLYPYNPFWICVYLRIIRKARIFFCEFNKNILL